VFKSHVRLLHKKAGGRNREENFLVTRPPRQDHHSVW